MSTKSQKTKLLKIYPWDYETASRCVETGQYHWCVIPERGGKTKFCTKMGWDEVKGGRPLCPGGTAYSLGSQVPEDVQNRHFESLTETCDEVRKLF